MALTDANLPADPTVPTSGPSPDDAPGGRPGWPTGLQGFGYGGDYNPEQWPQVTRLEDVELMVEAGVTIVSVAIFAWATIEPAEGEHHFEWLDETMDRLHAAGIRVALATATASPPPWLTARHPEILPQTADGTVLWQGGRQSYSVTHPLFREYALRMATLVAERYATHPALALWHVDNEIGCHVPRDYSDAAASAFRSWLAERYSTVEALNEAWGTAFWSQRYSAFEDVLPPRSAPTYANPTQQLDFDRFSSDALLGYYRDLRDALRVITPEVPITTNFMMSSATKGMDYYRWSPEVDVVANDHYTIASAADRHVELAFSADLSRGIAGGRPWILMEHSTSAVNWQPRNRPKLPGEMLRNSLAHVARGADAVMFFQWRQSKAGAEKFHSSMVPHAGRDTDVWRSTVTLGETLKKLAPVVGSTVRSRAALLFDYEAWWAGELDSHPTQQLRYTDEVLSTYTALWNRGVSTDVVHPSADLSGYDLVVVPTLYLVSDADAANVAAAAERGATVVVTYFSGIVDVNDHVRLGGYPGAFRTLLGVSTEEFYTLQEDETVHLSGSGERVAGTFAADLWTEKTHLRGATAVATYDDGPLAGLPAVTRAEVGAAGGSAWYVGARLNAAGVAAVVDAALADAGLTGEAEVPAGVEVVRRHAEDGTAYLFVLNHTAEDATVKTTGTDLLTGSPVDGSLSVPAAGVAVVQEA
ncbi:beta-galactosidase [Sanguibacter keddieii DSM 10542]|uniref:Beta-galactosidase n=1 Tax=Sanguibacter keddieii (strain ATCC 51767 / DSM 10542 / NCFB 3025 / ST-74) TaxID=446469 RepID=D1BB58_SANKS|nr:beta-galactosidase [Sanguibacter keddieii]ACZ20624.1 beta-galactosidase [Sanguibacter keddieii DSM 10542]